MIIIRLTDPNLPILCGEISMPNTNHQNTFSLCKTYRIVPIVIYIFLFDTTVDSSSYGFKNRLTKFEIGTIRVSVQRSLMQIENFFCQ